MQAVIMAGGKGTRLASVTKNIPKPMVPVGGKPLLEYQIENLKENGIRDVILIVGYLGEVIRDYFGDGSKFGVNISYYTEEIPLGTAGALAKIINHLEECFFLVFGDLFINVNFNRFLDFHRKQHAAVTLYAHPNSHPYDSDIIIINDEYRVTGWSYKKDPRTKDYRNLVNAGLYIMQRETVNEIAEIQLRKADDKVDLEKELIIPMIDEAPVYAYCSTEYVKDLGTPERLEKVTKDYFLGICEKRNLKYPQKCIFLDRDGTINKHTGFLRSAGQVELEPGAAEAIRLINESEYLAVVITNQPVVARGECSFEELNDIHNRLYTLLGREGAYLDGLYFCPHHPDKGFEGEVAELKYDCDCRKPKIGLLKRAEADCHADLSNSWFIGDTTVDVQTGLNAGMHTVMLRSGDPKKDKYNAVPEFVSENLLDAVKMILSCADT